MVYAWFGTGQIVALDMNGKLVWQRHLGTEISPFNVDLGSQQLADALRRHGHPAVRSRAGLVSARGGQAHRQASCGGPTAARAACPTARRSSSTTPTGPELIVNSSERVDAYDPRNGTLLWYTGGTNRFPIPMPVFHNGVIYMSRGYRSSPYMAIRPGGRGDISKSHVRVGIGDGSAVHLVARLP